MHVELGAPVYGTGGKRIGEVDGLIVDAGTKRASALLMTTGGLDRGQHMVAVSAIASGDSEGVHLDASGSTTDAQSPILDSEEIALTQRTTEPTTFIPAAGAGGTIEADPPARPGNYPDESSFFEMAPLDPPPVVVESNLEENEVALGHTSDVMSSDRHKLGDVVAYGLGEMGLIDSIVVSEGFIFKERSTFSLAEIEEFGTNAVHLRLTKDQAEAR